MEPSIGRVLQVNVSPGGVPKVPVERAWVGRLGLEGDGHSEPTVHGGPHRAVALFAMEAIDRVAGEGHPIAPGSCGENLTTQGIEWSTLPAGTRVRIGDRLVLELSLPDNPCSTIAGSFSDGRFARISILVNPTDSRMYARVVEEGEVRPGDAIEVLPGGPDPRAAELALLTRLDAAHRRSSLVRWQAARAAGLPLRLVDDGELAMAALPGTAGPFFNRGHGFEGLPNLVGRAIDFFADAGVDGWVDLEPDALPGLAAVAPEERFVTLAIEPDRVAAVAAARGPVAGLAIRTVGPDEGGAWGRVHLEAGGMPADATDAWLRSSERLAASEPGDLFVAELEGRPVAAGSLHVHKKVGWLRATVVLPDARGRGIQRALIAARAAAAEEAGATLVGSAAPPGSTSEANLRAMGLVALGTRGSYRTSALAPIVAG